MSRFRTCPFLVLLLALGLAVTASAQGERGVIAGVVSDAQGGVLPGCGSLRPQRRYRLHADGRDWQRGSAYASERCRWAEDEVKAELVGFTTATRHRTSRSRSTAS